MRRAAAVALLVVAFVAQGLLRPASGPDASVADPAITVLGGALRPLLVALTWVEAEAALDDRRLLDALDRLRMLEAIDPSGWEASAFRAHLIAHNLAEAGSPDARADRIAEAARVLDEAAARTVDPGPCVAKGQLMLETRMWERSLSADLEERLGATPRAIAVAALREAARRGPGSSPIQGLLREASRLAGIELLMKGAPPEEALRMLEEARALADGSPGDSLGRRLATGWAGIVRAAVDPDPAAVPGARDRFMAALDEWARIAPPSDASEAVFAAELLRALVPLAERRLREEAPRTALTLVEMAHTIRQFVAGRLDRTRLPLVQALADRRRILGILDEIARQSPDLLSQTSNLKELVSAW